MLVLNGGISPNTGQLNVKSRLYVAPDGLYNMSPTWATTIMANTEGKVVLSTAPNGGVTAPDGFQANAPFTIFDKFYGTYGVGLKMGIFRDTGAAYIQCENANTGARNICLQSYAGDVGIGTTSPVAKLDVAGSALIRDNLQLGTNANDYSLLTMGGGNTYGYMYANYSALGDGIHMGYNAYNVNGTWVRPGTGMGSGTSRISMGYGYIGLYTSGESNTNPPNNLGLYQNSGGQVGIGTTAPAATLDVSGTIGFSYTTLPTFTSSQIGYTYNVDTSLYIIQQTSFTTIATISSVPIGVWLFTATVLANVDSGGNNSVTIKIVAGTNDVQLFINRYDGANTSQNIGPLITVVNNTSVKNYTLQITKSGTHSVTAIATARAFRATRIA